MRQFDDVGKSDSDYSGVQLEVLRTKLVALTEELGAALANASPTFEISQAREFAVAIADGDGQIVAIDDRQQLGSLAQTVSRVVDYFQFDLNDGDIVITNDPYAGGVRVQDISLVSPLVIDGERLLLVAARVRIRDIGGQVSGSIYPEASEVWAEGVAVTPMKIQRFGRPVRDLLGAFLLNGRRPTETRRTLDAGTAALTLGHRRMSEMIEDHGIDETLAAFAYAQDYCERIALSITQGWSLGSYESERVLPLDADHGGPVTLRLKATVDRGSVTLDFSESDDQRTIFVNSAAGSTESRAIGAALSIMGDRVPANSGLLRVMDVQTRPGSITHPVQPAPVGWGPNHCGNEIVEVVVETLAEAAGLDLPEVTVPRPVTLDREAADRNTQTDLGRWAVGGSNAIEGRDGWGAPQLSARAQLPSVEQWEVEEGMRIESMEFAADTGGAGRWTGSPAIETIIDLLPDHLLTLWTESLAGAPAGCAGGGAGTPGEVSLHIDGSWGSAPRFSSEGALKADRILIRLAGGGGYGEPGERDRESVLADLEDDLISADKAREVYGVRVDDQEDGGRDG